MDINEKQLQEALNNDVAQKANEAAARVVVHPGVAIGSKDVEALEIKQAYLAKAVSLSYVDAAHACIRLALQEVSSVVAINGDLKQPTPKADPKRVMLLMDLGERVVKIARELDILGDKALVRSQEEFKPGTPKQ